MTSSVTTDNPALKQLLEVNLRTHEAGLLIVPDAPALKSASKSLGQAGLGRTTLPDLVASGTGGYVVIDAKAQYKDAYDVICQYPLGVVSLYDERAKQVRVVKPDYRGPLVFVATEATIAAMAKAGLDIVGRVGPTLRIPHAES